MQTRLPALRLLLAVLLVPGGMIACGPDTQALDPIAYTVRIPAPEAQIAEVEAIVPTEGRESFELMMPVWSPGYYRVEDYAGRIQDFSAYTPEGRTLEVERTRQNRWRIHAGDRPVVHISYRLLADQRSVTTNWVGSDMALLNGGATFVTLVEQARRPHDVLLELPPHWTQSMTALPTAPAGGPHSYRADDYDMLVDSPILAGAMTIHEFEVEGSRHYLANAGQVGEWDGEQGARDLAEIVRATYQFWGGLPFERYVFLNLFRAGGGGLEHRNSTVLTSNASRMATPRAYLSWLGFVSHEYFHSFNVKRLRPIELGPFDYENPPSTGSLWISEGLTTYFGDLMVVHAGLAGPEDFFANLSGHISQLQNSPGRHLQTLEEASLDVWNSGVSGVGRDAATTVSYYTKGPVVGFLLDARIRRSTDGARSLGDVMRLAYRLYGEERGFTPDEFRAVAEDVAGADLSEWFSRAISSTDELDYSEALDWFGLRFAAAETPAEGWRIEIQPAPTELQVAHLRALFEPGAGRLDALRLAPVLDVD